MRLLFGLSAYSRANGRLAPVRLINWIPEPSPTVKGGVTLLARPGLAPHTVRASVRGLYRADGVFSGDLFSVAGTTLYRGNTSLGTVASGGRAEWAYTVDGLFILSGGVVYQYDGSTLTATVFPDSALVASICQLDSVLYAVRSDTGTVYFRLPGDTAWNALDFFSAERDPDPALAVRTLGDALYVFGSASVELFAPTGDAAVPVQRIQGAAINRGLKDRDSIVALDNTLFFVAENDICYRITGEAPAIVSDNSIAERIEASTTAKAFAFSRAGHSLYVLGLDAETLVYNVSGGWSQYTFDGGAFPSLGIYDGQTAYVAGPAKIYTLADRSNDDGAVMERVFTAVLPVENPVNCDAVEIGLSPGVTPLGEEPAIIQLRWSDDQARTWADWRELATGFSGDYRKRVRYRRLGIADAPGRLFEGRITDDVDIRVSDVELNPPRGGRSRD